MLSKPRKLNQLSLVLEVFSETFVCCVGFPVEDTLAPMPGERHTRTWEEGNPIGDKKIGGTSTSLQTQEKHGRN